MKRGEGKNALSCCIYYTVIGIRKYNSAEPSSFLNNVRGGEGLSHSHW
jgi:hypothetical protein